MYNDHNSPIARAGQVLRALWTRLEPGISRCLGTSDKNLLERHRGSLDRERLDAPKLFARFAAKAS